MHDVLIVGAGPVGLFLACELGLSGCSVLVLEAEQLPDSPWRTAPLGTRGLSAASIEAFHRRGLLDALLSRAGVTDTAEPEALRAPPPRSVGHFAGITLDPGTVDLDQLPHRLPSPALDGLITTLDVVESVLFERAVELGVEIRRGPGSPISSRPRSR